jgi:FlaA1/EpsC-like NDP-sugar epimerase
LNGWVLSSRRAVGSGVLQRAVRAFAFLRTDVSFAVVDGILVATAYAIGLMVRFLDLPTGPPLHWWRDFSLALPAVIVVHLLTNVLFGTYGHVWEFASIAEAMRIALASAVAGMTLLAGLVAYRLIFAEVGPIPISTLVLGSVLTLLLTGAVRFRSRLFSFNRQQSTIAGRSRRVLVAGTGRSAADLVRHGILRGEPMQVVGFVTRERGRPDRRLAGLPVMGMVEDVPALVRQHEIDEVIVADSDGSAIVRHLVDLCMTVDVRLRIVPDIDSILSGGASVQDVRDLEPEDLLERASVQTDLEEVAATLSGRRVLVTGAGGSIGSELVRQILRFEPEALLALDHDETHLHEGVQSWIDVGGVLQPVLCDIRDRTRVLRVFEHYHPEIVFHAAAHKHVPVLEFSPEEAVKTNILATKYLLDGSMRVGVDRFVLISTDKAADPVSVMGASKRIAEMLVQDAAARGETGIYSAVRFGNVLGSRGSVVPTFVHQIKKGGPVTVTDPEMTRYFMTTGEAVELVLQAAAITQGGDVLVLDMGEPVRIVDLANRLIRLAGLVPGRDIKVQFTGVRPGEKLHEVLSNGPLRESRHPRIRVADQAFADEGALSHVTEALVRRAARGDGPGVRELMLAFADRDWGAHEIIDLQDLGQPERRPAPVARLQRPAIDLPGGGLG